MRNIYVIRHGEPDFPGGRPFCLGRMDLPISETGRAQAARLRDYFQDIPLEAVFCSALRRTQETARYLDAHPCIVPGFSELDMGSWEGLSFEEIRVKYPDLYRQRGEDPVRFRIPGGESLEDCRARAGVAFRAVLHQTQGNIAIVTHAGVIRVLYSELLDYPLQNCLHLKPAYCRIHTLTEDNGVIRQQV